jgi:hypothetical protein
VNRFPVSFPHSPGSHKKAPHLSGWSSGFRDRFSGATVGFFLLATLLLVVLVACGGDSNPRQADVATLPPIRATLVARSSVVPPSVTATPTVPPVDLTLGAENVTVGPVPLRAGFPFTVTAVVRNNLGVDAVDVPLMVHISAAQEEIGYSPFVELLTITVPASQSLPVEVLVDWNLAGGEHQLWVQVNRLPDAWQSRVATLPETDTGDNIALLELMVDPFDAYASDLCSGRVDIEIGPADVVPEPDQQRILVVVHNIGNRAVYNLPVIVLGDQVMGINYTPAIPPCGGTARVYVEVDRPLTQGESLTVLVNPRDWERGLAEDDFDNNRVSVAAGLAPGIAIPPDSGLEDYDFSISSDGIEIPQLWIVQVTVYNLGQRDADMVPIRVENEAGRKITDAIPLVQGNGLGVAAIRVGYLWTRGGTLTFTVNPQDAKGVYPETNRDNNVATFTLP